MTEGRRYRILGVLGRGGFGTVYRAELLGEGGFVRQVALKVLNADMEGVHSVAQRLRDEARLLGMLRHRAILQVDGLVKLDDRWTVVMEYIEGCDLADIVHKGPMPAGAAVEVIGEVASALHVAYSWTNPAGQPLKLLHRDIKPSNILLTSAGETKVLDFGIARASFEGREAMTKSVTFGSPGYMAPERMDFVELPAGDVYSLGCVLYEVIYGLPFGKASAKPAKHNALIAAQLQKLEQKQIPPKLVHYLGRMLAYDPDDRPLARDVENAMREFRSDIKEAWLRDWAEVHIPGLLKERGVGGEHDFSRSILTEYSGGTSGSSTPRKTFSDEDDVPAEAGNRPPSGPVAMPKSSASTTFVGDEPTEEPAAPPMVAPPPPPPPPKGFGTLSPVAATPAPAPGRSSRDSSVAAKSAPSAPPPVLPKAPAVQPAPVAAPQAVAQPAPQTNPQPIPQVPASPPKSAPRKNGGVSLMPVFIVLGLVFGVLAFVMLAWFSLMFLVVLIS